jgi:hypothetical protein
MRKRRIIFLGSGVLVLLLVGVALAAPNAFSLNWWTVDGGGGTSQGGDYEVSGTVGQPDTSPLMSGGDYFVVGGFWGGDMVPTSPNLVYLPLVFR